MLYNRNSIIYSDTIMMTNESKCKPHRSDERKASAAKGQLADMLMDTLYIRKRG